MQMQSGKVQVTRDTETYKVDIELHGQAGSIDRFGNPRHAQRAHRRPAGSATDRHRRPDRQPVGLVQISGRLDLIGRAGQRIPSK